MELKYKITDECKVFGEITLHRIEALKDFNDVKKGDKGGYIEKENNLSQYGDAWVCGDALVCGNAEVCGNAKVYGNAEVCGDAEVYGDAKVYGDAWVCGNAKVCGNADYIVFKNWWSSGRYFTWTRSNDKWRVGCFYGTGDELIAKAYEDSETSGKNYEKIVKYVESIK